MMVRQTLPRPRSRAPPRCCRVKARLVAQPRKKRTRISPARMRRSSRTTAMWNRKSGAGWPACLRPWQGTSPRRKREPRKSGSACGPSTIGRPEKISEIVTEPPISRAVHSTWIRPGQIPSHQSYLFRPRRFLPHLKHVLGPVRPVVGRRRERVLLPPRSFVVLPRNPVR